MLRTATVMPNPPWLVDRKVGSFRLLSTFLWVLIRAANKVLANIPWKINIGNRIVSHKFFMTQDRWAGMSREHIFGYSGTLVNKSGLHPESYDQILNRPENVPCFFDPEVKAVGNIFVHASNTPYNYFHFVYDFILPLFTHRLGDKEVEVYLPFQPTLWQLEWLKLIGQTKVRFAKFNGHLSSEKISKFDTFLNSKNEIKQPQDLNNFRKFIRGSISQPRLPQGGAKRIYLKRSKGPMGRNLINQNELMSHLQSLGFVVFSLDGLSVGEQLSLFTNVSTIISPHDAGLSNLLACTAGTEVIELLPVQGIGLYDMYKNISSIAGLQYSNVVSLHSMDYSIGDNFSVDFSEVDKILGI